MKSILVIEDSIDTQILIKKILSPVYQVTILDSADGAMEVIIKNKPDLLLLDLNLPGISGYEFCNQIRSRHEFNELPIIIISAKSDTNSHVMAYKLGADNFLDKPFEKDELLALVETKLKRTFQERHIFNNLQIDVSLHQVMVDDVKIDLTPKEFKILHLLLKHMGEVLSRERILNSVWGDAHVTDRVIDNHINALRKKLAGAEISIESVYSEGYRILVHEKDL